jgi:formylglycine-generating enzyme required for sulfatase activity
MARIEKSVFISYRRADVYTALAVYQDLTNKGFDVFFDYTSIASGDFEQIIVGNIKARAHFVLILTPTALDRCSEPDDWLRREIETAIDERRNIIPLFFKGFEFGTPSVSEKLTGNLKDLPRYNGLNVHEDYFHAAMDRLSGQFLNIPLDTLLHPISYKVQKVVEEEQVAVNEALKQREAIKGPDRPAQYQRILREWLKNLNLRPYGTGAVVLLAVALAVAGIYSMIQNLGERETATPTQTNDEVVVLAPTQISTNPTSSPTDIVPFTPVPTPTVGVGSMMESSKDNMTLLFVPAGEFDMGSNNGEDDEKPIHIVSLESFWIDQTEVTNALYASCIEARVCNPPSSIKSFTRDHYFGNSEFNDYPVLWVSWSDAKTYCEWVGRRLPTEAEWEKAAGWDEDNQTQSIYPWGNNSFDGSRANICDTNCPREVKESAHNDGYADTAPVGTYPDGASFYGAYNMAGNVWEWVEGWYDAYPGNTKVEEEYGTTHRVVRGGSWFLLVFRTANRAPQNPAEPNDAIGFRCAMDATP